MTAGSFDDAAPGYEAARGFPPGVGDLVAEAAQRLLAGRRHVLEIGAGTGRITRPLLARGVRVSALDLSRPMLARLLGALPPGPPRPDLVQGAAEALPLAGGSFEAALSVHVFHLIPAWQSSLAEMRRILRPGGIFLSGYDWRPDASLGTRLMDQWRRIVAARGAGGVAPSAGTHDFADIARALRSAGAQVDEVTAGAWTTTRTLARSLEAIEHRTWNLPGDFYAKCLAELRAWAVAEFGALDQEFATPHQFVWQRFAWPPAG